ncbi:MAG: hypothetical protein GW763_10385 [Paraglaciecola sp.]|nr:hypothetical protein [Paraglaciecola sp.]NCT48376.1 hypothetical protein [Paraglaciecola sp.]
MMILQVHEKLSIKTTHIGLEQTPVLIIDNFIQQTDALIDYAEQLSFRQTSPFYPGVRAPAPREYQRCLLDNLQTVIVDFFKLPTANLGFSGCDFSLVSTPPQQLRLLQRIPHFDALNINGLAAVHYLFKEDFGGTAFYRHRKTGFETIDESREITYLKSLESENDGPHLPRVQDGYINGDTPLFERIAESPGLFNRLIIYRRHSLHSGSISNENVGNADVRRGRLTINSFIECR